MTSEERDYPWENVAVVEAELGFAWVAEGQPMQIKARLRGVSSTMERAQTCCDVTFRLMLDAAGIPWRTMGSDGRLDSDEEHQSDPG